MRFTHLLYLSASLVCAAFAGCGAEEQDKHQVKVFKSDNSRQCEDTAIPLTEMRKELTSAGIDVICSQKGDTGMAQATVCGGGTGDINIYLIHANNLPDAEKLGFQPVSKLTDYKDSRCVE